jgi:hypothetical protein
MALNTIAIHDQQSTLIGYDSRLIQSRTVPHN